MALCSYKMQPANLSRLIFVFTTIKIELYRSIRILQFKISICFLMIVFALCLATFELLKQTLTQWSFIFGYSIQIHSSGVVRQTIVSPCFSTPASEMIGITHYVSHMKKTKQKNYTMNIHDSDLYCHWPKVMSLMLFLHERICDSLAHQSPMKSFGVFITLFWLIYASELKFRSGRPLLVQLGPLKQEVWSRADFYNSTARSVNCWE